MVLLWSYFSHIWSLNGIFWGLQWVSILLVSGGTELTPPQGVGKALQQVWSVKECGKVIEIPNIQVHNSHLGP